MLIKKGQNLLRNSTEVFKSFSIPSVSGKMNLKKIGKDPNHCAKNAQDWGKGDYKAIIDRNMKGYKKNEQVEEGRHDPMQR